MKTDAQLETDVQAELDFDPKIKHAGAIAVGADRGIVTLRGTVGSFHQFLAAEQAAKRVAGTISVDNQLDVRLMDELARDDADIRGAALQALELNATVPADAIDVKVTGGRVVLKGTVDWKYQKDAAESTVSVLVGVLAVRNEIEVEAPATEAGALAYRIEDAFKRSAQMHADAIRITVDDGRVVLDGDVTSWAEHDAALAAASALPGVRGVDDRLSIVG